MEDRTPRGYLFKPILIFCCIMIGWPVAKRIWRLAYKPVPDCPVNSPDSRSNASTSGAPSEVGDDEFVIPKCKSAFIAKLQSPVDSLGPRCGNELFLPISIMKFDGCTAPPHAVKYANGVVQIEMRNQRSHLYDANAQSAECFSPHCPEAGFHSRVGHEPKLECLTHTKRRINTSKVSLEPSVVDLTEREMPLSPNLHRLHICGKRVRIPLIHVASLRSIA